MTVFNELNDALRVDFEQFKAIYQDYQNPQSNDLQNARNLETRAFFVSARFLSNVALMCSFAGAIGNEFLQKHQRTFVLAHVSLKSVLLCTEMFYAILFKTSLRAQSRKEFSVDITNLELTKLHRQLDGEMTSLKEMIDKKVDVIVEVLNKFKEKNEALHKAFVLEMTKTDLSLSEAPKQSESENEDSVRQSFLEKVIQSRSLSFLSHAQKKLIEMTEQMSELKKINFDKDSPEKMTFEGIENKLDHIKILQDVLKNKIPSEKNKVREALNAVYISKFNLTQAITLSQLCDPMDQKIEELRTTKFDLEKEEIIRIHHELANKIFYRNLFSLLYLGIEYAFGDNFYLKPLITHVWPAIKSFGKIRHLDWKLIGRYATYYWVQNRIYNFAGSYLNSVNKCTEALKIEKVTIY